jgi:hypothetical protein
MYYRWLRPSPRSPAPALQRAARSGRTHPNASRSGFAFAVPQCARGVALLHSRIRIHDSRRGSSAARTRRTHIASSPPALRVRVTAAVASGSRRRSQPHRSRPSRLALRLRLRRPAARAGGAASRAPQIAAAVATEPCSPSAAPNAPCAAARLPRDAGALYFVGSAFQAASPFRFEKKLL